jgi:hypothetical protein|tara:strand:- start:286 stop:471 length:186 start_codon:yes stop_codon:yes gene_type:complete
MEVPTSKPSCIQDLKELVNNLTDRDINIKNHLSCIKKVIEDKKIKCDTVKINKIKQILKDG